jgi:hypothetical protein
MQMRYLKSINKKIINNTMTKKKKEQRPSNDLQNITQKTEQIEQNENKSFRNWFKVIISLLLSSVKSTLRFIN